MRTELFMYFCIKKYIGTQGEVCRQLKIFLTPSSPLSPPPTTVVYATDRPKAVVPFVLILCRFVVYNTGASCFKVFPCSLTSCFFILFSIVITSLGEEGAGLHASRAFVCLFCTCFVLLFFSSS